MAYDEEYNKLFVKQCKDLLRSEVGEEWQFYKDLVVNNFDKLTDYTLSKIQKLLIQWPGCLGKPLWKVNVECREIVWMGYSRKTSKGFDPSLYHKILDELKRRLKEKADAITIAINKKS